MACATDNRDDDYDRSRDRYLTVEGPEGTLEMRVGSKVARIDGRTIELAQPVEERDRVVYVPLEVLSHLTREGVVSDGTRIARIRI